MSNVSLLLKNIDNSLSTYIPQHPRNKHLVTVLNARHYNAKHTFSDPFVCHVEYLLCHP